MNVTDLLWYWVRPLACLSLPSVMSWIKSDTLIWKLAISHYYLAKNQLPKINSKFSKTAYDILYILNGTIAYIDI